MNKLNSRLLAVFDSKKFLYFALGLFLVQGCFFALTIAQGVPPDERYQIGLIIYFAENGLNPFAEQASNFELGDIERQVSYLYNLLFAAAYFISPFTESVTFYLFRLVNVLFGFGSLIVLKKIGDRLKLPVVVTHFAVFMMATALMFVFLSGAINYDNLVILISLLSFYVGILLWERVTTKKLLAFGALILLGSLIKYPYLPLAVLFVIYGIYAIHKDRSNYKIKQLLPDIHPRKEWKNTVLAVIIIILTVLALERIGGNVLIHGSVNPRCDSVHSVAECEEEGLFRRNQMMLETRPDESRFIGTSEFSRRWVITNFERTYGIFAHQRFEQPDRVMKIVFVFLGILLFAAIRKVEPRREQLLSMIYGSSIFYIFVVAYVNYGLYQMYGRFSLALQGRYTFLVLPLFYLISVYYLSKLLPNRYGYILAIMTIVFFGASLPIFLLSADIEWYNQLGINIREYLR